ncbi:MAG: SDR family NAD(P)-dependent oxidoreductase [Fibrobacterota bacterium]
MPCAAVTGAASGIGREFVRLLDQSGAWDVIFVLSRREERLTALKEECRTAVVPIAGDQRTPALQQALQTELHNSCGELTCLIHSAGFGKNNDFTALSRREQTDMIDLNCTSLMEITGICLPFMPRGGRIITISSIAGFAPVGSYAVYGASKAFVNSFSMALRAELYERGITVTTVTPGSVDTDFHRISKGEGGREKKRFNTKACPRTVAARALADSKKGRGYSTPGVTALLMRWLRKFLPPAWAAHKTYNSIYGSTAEVQ